MQLVRASDRERYLATLYAPEEKRPALFALYAFNAEIAAVRDRIRDAPVGEIRLQWWRDVIDGTGSGAGHPVAEALLETIATYALPRGTFENYLEARVFDLYDDPMPSRTDLEGYCGETASALLQLSGLVLYPQEAPRFAEAAGHAGCAQAIVGLLRLLPRHLPRGQCYLPRDLLAAAGTTPEALVAGKAGDAAAVAVRAMVALAREHLAAFAARAASLPASLRPAFLPLSPIAALLDRMDNDPARVLKESVDLPMWRKHWLYLRRASRGWPGR